MAEFKMSANMYDVIEHILSAPADDVWGVTSAYLAELGCETLLYAYVNPNTEDFENAPFTFQTTVPEDWFEYYFEQEFQTLDHTYLMRRQGSRDAIKLGSNIALPDAFDDVGAKRVNDECGDAGFGATTNFWLPSQSGKAEHDIHCITIGTAGDMSDMNASFEANGRKISLITQVMHNRLSHTLEAQTYPALTSRERECLTWIALGCRPDRIADKLAIAIPTVTFHLGNARRKLQSKTLYEAIAKAVRLQMINI